MLERDDAVLWPTHGPPIREPRPFVEAYLQHRLDREAQVLGCVTDGVSEIPAIVARLYADVRPELHEPAAWAVLGHLVKLTDDGVVQPDRSRSGSTRASGWPDDAGQAAVRPVSRSKASSL